MHVLEIAELLVEMAVSLLKASEPTKSSKWLGSTPRLAKPMISPLRATILRANIVVQTLVILLTAGSTITSGVGLPDVNSWK